MEDTALVSDAGTLALLAAAGLRLHWLQHFSRGVWRLGEPQRGRCPFSRARPDPGRAR